MNNFFKGWSTFEKIWLGVFLSIIVATGIIFDDNWIGMTASITGVLCVVLVSQGKLSNYFFGIINTILYAYISYKANLLGETMLNAFFYLPIQFIGFYLWSNNMKKTSEGVAVVKAKKLTEKGWLLTGVSVVIIALFYRFFLIEIGSSQAGLDAVVVVLSITAQLLMLKRFAEQWVFWIIVNLMTITLWLNVFISSGNSITILVMQVAFLVNSVYGYLKWNKMAKEQRKSETHIPQEEYQKGF